MFSENIRYIHLILELCFPPNYYTISKINFNQHWNFMRYSISLFNSKYAQILWYLQYNKKFKKFERNSLSNSEQENKRSHGQRKVLGGKDNPNLFYSPLMRKPTLAVERASSVYRIQAQLLGKYSGSNGLVNHIILFWEKGVGGWEGVAV